MIRMRVVIKMTKYFWKIKKNDTKVCCHKDDKVLLDDTKKNNDTNVCCHEDDDVKLWYKCVLYHEVDKVLFDEIIFLLQYNDDTRH